MVEKRKKLLVVENLKLRISSKNGETSILSNISFKLNQGESLALLGPSGSGKSMTALSILQAYKNDNRFHYHGSVWWFEEDRQDDLFSLEEKEIRKFRQRKVAYISQESESSLNPSYKIKTQLKQVFDLSGNLSSDNFDQIVEDILNQLDIEDVERIMNSYPFQLSGGQLQRITIAIALIKKPDIIIFDEPCSSLDVIRKRELLSLIRKIQEKDQIAILYITHDLEMVRHWIDKIVVLDNGSVLYSGARFDPDFNVQEYLLELSPLNKRQDNKGKNLTLPENPILQLINLSAYYPEKSNKWFTKKRKTKIISELNFSLYKGSCIGICGLSGSGKSTLVNCISGLHNMWDGEMYFASKKMGAIGLRDLSQKKAIQLVLQNSYSALNPSMRVKNMFKEIFRIHGVPNKARTVSENIRDMLEKVNLSSEISNRFPSEISGGQRQRLNLARALALKPELLICDESVSSLDKQTQKDILDLLSELIKNESLALLFISHDYKAVSYLANEIIFIENGKIVQQATNEIILKKPANEYVQSLTRGIEAVDE